MLSKAGDGGTPRVEVRTVTEGEGENQGGTAILGPPDGVCRPRPHVMDNLTNAVESFQSAVCVARESRSGMARSLSPRF